MVTSALDTPPGVSRTGTAGRDPLVTSARLLALLVVLVAFTRTAWIGDDALITLRHALNMTHGWGYGFNATEAVLGSTHPLWLWMWAGVGQLTDMWMLSNFALSIAFSVSAVAMVLWSAKTLPTVIASGALLVLSSAVVDYSTSGLENPLAMFLVGLLVLQSRGGPQISGWARVAMGLTAAALLLTRTDLALLVFPALAMWAWQFRRCPLRLGVTVLAFLLPLAAWAAWSWTTYSALLPNTLDAKSNVDIPRSDLLLQGLRYLQVSIQQDWATGIVLVAIAVLVAWFGIRWHRLWLLGASIYLAYVAWVGGDFMVGRFLAVPVFLVILLFVQLPKLDQWILQHGKATTVAVVAAISSFALLAVVWGPTPTSLTRDPAQRWPGSYGVGDERGVYSELGRTLHVFLSEQGSANDFTFVPVAEADSWGRLVDYEGAARAWPVNSAGPLEIPDEVGSTCWLGATSLVTGPRVHWIDICALTDRFLAGIPFEGDEWIMGHFFRPVPAGYPEAVLTNDPQRLESPELREDLEDLWARIKQ